MQPVAASGAPAASASNPGDVLDPVPLVPLSMDEVLRQVRAQMELPARADFVALSMGHSLLITLLMLGLWLYASTRLWRAARRRVRATGGRPLLQVGCWFVQVGVGVFCRLVAGLSILRREALLSWAAVCGLLCSAWKGWPEVGVP